MTVHRYGFYNGAMTYMFGESTIHIIFVDANFCEAKISNLMIDFYLTECLPFLIKLHMASQNLKQFCTQSIFGHNGTEGPPPWLGPVSFFFLRV